MEEVPASRVQQTSNKVPLHDARDGVPHLACGRPDPPHGAPIVQDRFPRAGSVREREKGRINDKFSDSARPAVHGLEHLEKQMLSNNPRASDASSLRSGSRHTDEETGLVHNERVHALLGNALQEHLSLRSTCNVTPELAIAVDEAFHGLDDILYADAGWILPDEELSDIVRLGGFPTYGELLPSGVDKLVRLLGMDASATFYDLGAGTCRSLLHLAMAQPHLRKAVGIELSPTRLEYGELAYEKLAAGGTVMCPTEMRQGNVEDKIYQDATHVFVSSVCFDDFLLRKIAENLGESDSFRVLVSLRQLPIQPHLVLLGRTTLPNTFHGAQPAFVYVRHGLDRAPAATLSEFLCTEGACWLPSHFQEAREAFFIGEA
jgi:hypothetical protein